MIEDIRDVYADEFFKLAGIADGEAGDKQMRAYVEKRVKAYKVAYGVMQAADVKINEDDCKSFRIGYVLVPAPSSTAAFGCLRRYSLISQAKSYWRMAPASAAHCRLYSAEGGFFSLFRYC